MRRVAERAAIPFERILETAASPWPAEPEQAVAMRKRPLTRGEEMTRNDRRWRKANTRSWSVGVLAALLTASIAVTTPAAASGPKLKLTVALGPPATATKAKGSGYPSDDSITIMFDGSAVASTTSSATGSFAAPFRVPASATPGPHTVSAIDVTGLGASTTFTVQTDWLSTHFDSRNSGFNPYENVLSPSNVANLTQVSAPQWGAFLHSEPIYAGGELVVGSSDGTLRELDPLSGNQRWSFTTGGAIDGSPVAVLPKEGQPPYAVVVGSGDGNVYGVDPVRGIELWSLSMGGPISGSPVLLEGGTLQLGQNVVVVSDSGAITLLNGCSGAPLWSGTLTLGSAPPEAETPAVLRNVTLSDGTSHTIVVVSDGAGTLALDAGTGKQLWTVDVPCLNPPCSAVAWGAGTLARIVVGTGDPTAVELNAGTGTQIWSTRFPAAVSGMGLFETPVAGAVPAKFSVQAIIAGDTAGGLYSLNPKTGVINWGDAAPCECPVSSPAIANGVIYLTMGPVASTGQDGALIGYDGSGRQLFSADTADLNPQPYPPAPPTIADGRVYVGDFSGGVRVFALAG